MADDVLAKDVFSFICEFGGYVELSVLLEDVSSPLRGRKSELQARNWLKTQRGVVVIENDGKIEGVRVHLKKKICKQYADKGSCRRAKGKCKFWHICKGFLEGHCGGICSRSHDFFDNENRVKTQQLGIDKYPNTLVKKIVGWSLPQVCQLYLRGGCNSNKCFRLHVCSMAVQGSHCGCSLSHSLVNNHNRAILNQFDLVPHPSLPIEFVRCSVLVPKDPQILGDAKQLFKEGSSDSVCSESMFCGNQSNLNFSVFSERAAVVTTYKEPSEMKVFETLCKEYQCSVSFSVISKRRDLFPCEFKNVEGWFRRMKGSFLLTESEHGMILQVAAYSRRARVCLSYNNGAGKAKCEKQNCGHLHICREYITDSCINGVTCSRNHNFQDERNKKLLKSIKLDTLTDEVLRKLVLSSTPQACGEYNNGICDRGDSCGRIHICSKHLKKSCSEGSECDLEHDSAMHTRQTEAILERYQLNYLSRNIVKWIILVCDDSTKSKEAGHIHEENPEALICPGFLLRKCKKGFKCQRHHCLLPFHWQYKANSVWKSFNERDNDEIEKTYCNVMREQCEVTNVQLSFGRDKDYDATILLDKMMLLQRDFDTAAPLRRLSTVSSVQDPDNIMATQWIWYWKDEYGTWRKYDVDHVGRDLQQDLEEAFLNKRDGFGFWLSDQDYRINFVPESDMTQTNEKYGTTRKVRRRPLKFVSREDIQLMKRSETMLLANQQRQKKTKTFHLPAHWSSMPYATKYRRVPLSSLSDEFKDVENLFRKSIRKSVEIVRIERVQNPFMWEKYQRMKENMSAARNGSINEKQLFHGTSPNSVEAICKHNFDWRLHGKNATKYGEGSYFALNSSYSDSYASQDDNSSQFIFVAKVLVGSYTKGESTHRRPPAKDPSNPASDLYDCCVDNTWSPSIFVVFDTDQFYPEYIIEYCAFRQTSYSGYPGVYQQQPAKPLPVPRKVNIAPSAPLQLQRSPRHTTASGNISTNPVTASLYDPGTSDQSVIFSYSNPSYPMSADTAPSVASPYSSAVSRVASSPYSSSTSNAVYSSRSSSSNLPTWNTGHITDPLQPQEVQRVNKFVYPQSPEVDIAPRVPLQSISYPSHSSDSESESESNDLGAGAVVAACALLAGVGIAGAVSWYASKNKTREKSRSSSSSPNTTRTSSHTAASRSYLPSSSSAHSSRPSPWGPSTRNSNHINGPAFSRPSSYTASTYTSRYDRRRQTSSNSYPTNHSADGEKGQSQNDSDCLVM